MCQLPFGAYVQVHDDLDMKNTIESRATGVINLGPTGNIQGTHQIFSLKIGELVVRRRWTKLPIPSDMIDRLEELAEDIPNVLEQEEEEEEQYTDDGEQVQPELFKNKNNRKLINSLMKMRTKNQNNILKPPS
jgi:hypothetical protein